MAKGKANVQRLAAYINSALRPDFEMETMRLFNRRSITEALIRIVNRNAPNNPQGRTFADLIVEVMFLRALKGDVQAIKEITDRVEGRIYKSRRERSPVTNISDKREPTPILATAALVRIVSRKVSNDPQGRTFADLIAEKMVLQALKGDVRAVKEITDRVEGRVPQARPERTPIKNISDVREPQIFARRV